jgi:hypothetical protein
MTSGESQELSLRAPRTPGALLSVYVTAHIYVAFYTTLSMVAMFAQIKGSFDLATLISSLFGVPTLSFAVGAGSFFVNPTWPFAIGRAATIGLSDITAAGAWCNQPGPLSDILGIFAHHHLIMPGYIAMGTFIGALIVHRLVPKLSRQMSMAGCATVVLVGSSLWEVHLSRIEALALAIPSNC